MSFCDIDLFRKMPTYNDLGKDYFGTKRLKAPEEKQKITNEILVLSDKINYLKREVEFCESVKERSQKIKSNIKEIEQKEQELNNEKRKERSKNEYSR